jgi:TPR repeat protein
MFAAFLALFVLVLALAIRFGGPIFPRRSTITPSRIAPVPIFDLGEFKLKAEQGEAPAQVALGDVLAEGRGVRRDYQEAARWFRLAAAQGNAEAQNKLGMLCQAGQGLPQDDVEAVRYFRLAAAQGHVGAEYNLASAYGGGRGVPQNSQESARWYLQAAGHGDAYAQFNVAQRYELGRGVAADQIEAYKWYELAARGAVEDARPAASRLKGQLSAAQLRDALMRVKNFEDKRNQTDAKP